MSDSECLVTIVAMVGYVHGMHCYHCYSCNRALRIAQYAIAFYTITGTVVTHAKPYSLITYCIIARDHYVVTVVTRLREWQSISYKTKYIITGTVVTLKLQYCCI